MMAGSGEVLRYRSDRPLLAVDKPWEEGATLRAVSVMPDDRGGRLRLYYVVWSNDDPSGNALCVAYSRDGFDWEKPDLGEGHNVVMRGSGCTMDWGVFSPHRIIHDPEDEDEGLRWKLVYWDRPTDASPPGLCLAGSRDGLEWHRLGDYPIITGANDGSSLIAVHGRGPLPWLQSQYHLYQQTWKYNPALPTERDNLKGMHRRMSLWTAKSFRGKWLGPTVVLEPDENDPPDLQFYWLTPFHRKNGFGGLLACHHTTDQTMDIQLVTSEDGWTWQRENGRQPILPVGEAGRFDCGMVFSLSGPMRVGNRTYILYSGRATVHDRQLRYPDQERPEPQSGVGIAEIDPAVLDIP